MDGENYSSPCGTVSVVVENYSDPPTRPSPEIQLPLSSKYSSMLFANHSVLTFNCRF